MKSSDDAGAQLSELLHGIERASALEEAVDERGRRAEARLTSYNAALLFAHRARRPQPSITASFSASLVPPPSTTTPVYFEPPFVGVNAFINVKITNHTAVAVGAGWNLRLSTEDRQDKHRFTKQYNVPLPNLDPSGNTAVAFPINLVSHAPLVVSLQLHFVIPQPDAIHPSAGQLRPSRNRCISLVLASDVVLDILTFSTLLKRPSSSGFHHRRLRSSRVNQSLANTAPPHDPLPLSSRLHLATGSEKLKAVSGHHRSLLGADFSIDITSCDKRGVDAMLRAPPGALPFLRAAILRLCLKDVVERVAPTSMEIGESWERRLVDGADSSQREMGQVDRAITEMRLLKTGPVQGCAKGEDRVALRRTVGTIEAASVRWQQTTRGAWRPENM